MKPTISEEKHLEALTASIDVPRQQPAFPIPLPSVGISQKNVWVQLPQGHLPFVARLEVNLAADKRGIHMSRMEEVISLLYGRNFTNLTAYAEEAGNEILRRQDAETAKIELNGKLPILRQSMISGKNSLDSIDIKTNVHLRKKGTEISCRSFLGVGVNHITACPCTQAYNNVLFAGNHLGKCPLPTHSQRSHTWLLLEVSNGRPGFDEMLACLESSLHITQDLLKRQDEAEVVFRSHSLPQFAEDVVRETAYAVGKFFGSTLPSTTSVKIESVSLESIHIHDVYCILETKMEDIQNTMKSD